MNIFRGSWIPASKREGNQRFFCPFCGESVYMLTSMATYPTCPWCITDMPELDDFETPDELHSMKLKEIPERVERKPAPVSDEEKRQRRREQYAADREHRREYAREYYRRNNAESERRKERNRENARRYRESHHDEILAKARADRAANPEKYREYARRRRKKLKKSEDTQK